MHVTNNKLPLLCLVMNAFGFVTVTSKSTLSPSPPVVIKVDVDPYSANRIGMRYLDGTANDPEKRRKLIVATDGYEYLGSFSAGQWETAVELLQDQHVEHVDEKNNVSNLVNNGEDDPHLACMIVMNGLIEGSFTFHCQSHNKTK